MENSTGSVLQVKVCTWAVTSVIILRRMSKARFMEAVEKKRDSRRFFFLKILRREIA
jgi:hypothetical protein